MRGTDVKRLWAQQEGSLPKAKSYVLKYVDVDFGGGEVGGAFYPHYQTETVPANFVLFCLESLNFWISAIFLYLK